MSAFIGACPELIESFEATISVPQVNESTVSAMGEFYSAPFTISRGLWSVSFNRIEHEWDGHSHAFPIYKTQFHVILYGTDIPGIGQYWLVDGWPCASINDNYFTRADVDAGWKVLPNSRSCYSSRLVDLGCPQCMGLIGGELQVQAATAMAYENSYAFDVHVVGSRIG